MAKNKSLFKKARRFIDNMEAKKHLQKVELI